MATQNTYSLDLELGSSQYADISDASQTGLDIISDFSAECWVKFETLPAAGNYMAFLSKYTTAGDLRCYTFHLFNDAGTLKIGNLLSSNGIAATHGRVAWTPSTGVWYHVACVYDATAGTVNHYIDGVSLTQVVAMPNSISDETSDFQVGAFNTDNYLDGEIDEVRVWSDKRTQLELIMNRYVQVGAAEAGLVAYWRLNNDYLDRTSNDNDLTAQAAPVFDNATRGVPFTYYLEAGLDNLASGDFELASTQYAFISNGDQTGLNMGSGDFTVEAWIKAESDTGALLYCVMIKGAGGALQKRYVLYLDTNMNARFDIDDDGGALKSVVGLTVIIPEVWYHFAGVRDGNNLRIYVNGKEDNAATDITGYGDIDDTEAFTIGAANLTGSEGDTQYFDGNIDEARVWDVARTGTQIRENMDNYVVPGDEANLQGYWRFEGDYLDETTNDNDLTDVNSPIISVDSAFDPRGSRRSIDFEAGSSEYAAISDANQTGLDLGDTFTLEAWINLESQPGVNAHYTIIGKYDDVGNNRQYRFNYRDTAGTKKLEIIISQDGAGTNDTESVNWTADSLVWYHVAVTIDIGANEAKFYVDGSQQGSTQTTTIVSLADKAEAFRIGASDVGGVPSLFFDGVIDEVRAWSDVRTVTEIAGNMNERLDGDEAGLVGYWQLANNYSDTTSNGNNLIPVNTPTVTQWTPFDGSVTTALRDIVQPGIVPFLR